MDIKLNLPLSTFLNKFIPKSKFYEKTGINSKVQKEFTDKIKRITWKYKLSEKTTGIDKTDKVEEIQVFEIELKEKQIPENVLKTIDKAIPYQILYILLYENFKIYAVSLKGFDKSSGFYFSSWNEEKKFDFTGTDLEKVYKKIILSFIEKNSVPNEEFEKLLKKEQKIKALKKEISSLENKIKKEKQFNKKVEINKLLLSAKKKLENIEKDFE
jgi:hypothetical protein